MHTFTEIFRKLNPDEYNQYPFMLAVKKEGETCFAPIRLKNVYTLVDRAFVTIAGGLSAPPEDPWAMGGDGYFCYSDPIIKPISEPDSTYEYWVLKDSENPVACEYFKYVCGKINSVFEHGKHLLGEEESESNVDDPIRLIGLKSPMLKEVYSDRPVIKEFVMKAMDFLGFDFAPACDIDELKKILKDLYNACADIQNSDLTEEIQISCHADYDADSGGDVDNHAPYVPRYSTILCSKECWGKTFSVLDKITDFDFDKNFAYCDISGRQTQLAALGDILSQKVNCLFYHKWTELFQWYSNRMQAASFNMIIKEATATASMNVLSKICDLDYSCVSGKCFFLYTDIEDKNQPKPNKISSSEYFSRRKNKGYKKALESSTWQDISASLITESVCDEMSQFQIVMKNLFWLFDKYSTMSYQDIDKQKDLELERDIKFNETTIAKEVRVFVEFSLKLLCYCGMIPMASITGSDEKDKTTGKIVKDSAGNQVYHICKEFPYYLKDQNRVNTSPCDTKNNYLSRLYDGQTALITCLQNIGWLSDMSNPLMHHDVIVAGNFTKRKIREILDIIVNVSKFLETLSLN